MDVELTTIVLLVGTPLALVMLRLFVVSDGISLEDLVAPPTEMPWPHGVQEEEPFRWRVEALTPRDRDVRTIDLPMTRPEHATAARAGFGSKPAG